jgi:hypothetical protein
MSREVIRFKKWYETREQEGEVLSFLADGRLKVRVFHKAARGGDWIGLIVHVKPSEVLS